MKRWTLPLLVLLTTAPANAIDRPMVTVNFAPHDFRSYGVTPDGRQAVTQLLNIGGASIVIKAGASSQAPYHLTIYERDNPDLNDGNFTLVGVVAYEEVAGDACIELVCEFPDGTKSVSRTDATLGPALKITGTSAARPFRLKVDSPHVVPPKHIAINLVLPSAGTVRIANAEIVEEYKSRVDKAAPVIAPPTVTERPDGSILVKSTASDPTGTRQVVLKVFDRRTGDPNAQTVHGRLQWQNVEGKVALNGYTEALNGTRKSFYKGWNAFDGEQGQVEFAYQTDVANPKETVLTLLFPGTGTVALWDVALIDPATLKAEPIVRPPFAKARLTARAIEWAEDRLTVIVAALAAVALALIFPLRRLTRRGRGRTMVTACFMLLLILGAAQLFAAGVALGAGRSTDKWATLLVCAVVMIVIPFLTLRDVGRRYAAFELRKLHALDVA